MSREALELSGRVRAATDALIRLRRELHAHPELAGQERWSQARVLALLDEAGVEAHPLAGTGVVGYIPGRAPGPVVLARADLDGLELDEQTGADYASRNPGCMHACGHDAHVAMLLTAARLLAQAPPERGGVKLVFEPAEETGQGARAMIEAGVLDDPSVDHALAFHVWSDLPTGSLVCLDGPAMAGVDTFELTVTGRGSHAARPEDGLDPIPVAAQVITAAQTLVSRRLPPHQAAVLSFTSVRAGRAFNVIPETARLKGTVRAFDPDARRLLIDELKLIADETAAAFGASARYQGFESVPPLVNDAIQAERLRAVASELLGAEQVLPAEPLMVGEDFGLFAGHVPSAMALLGCGRPGPGSVYPHHHPRFDIDERVLGVGVELWLRLLADP